MVIQATATNSLKGLSTAVEALSATSFFRGSDIKPVETPSPKLSFSNADLRGAKLTDSSPNLSQANLAGMDFTSALKSK